MDQQQPNTPAKKTGMSGIAIAITVCLVVLGAGTRYVTTMKMSSVSAETDQVRELSQDLDALQQKAIYDSYSDPDAMVNYQTQHTESLRKFREENPDDDSIDAFMVDFVLASNETAPDTSVIEAEIERILDYSTIQTRADLVERANRLRELDGLVVEMIEWTRELPNDFESQLKESDFSAKKQRQAKHVFEVGFNMPARVKIQELDRRILRVVNQVLEVLHNSWGRWTYDTESGQLLFDDDAELAAMNKLFDSFDKLADEQQAVQLRILTEAQRGR